MNFNYDINKISDPILRETLEAQMNEAKKSRGNIIKSKEGTVAQIYNNLALLFYCNRTGRTANKEYWKQELATQFVNFFSDIVSSKFDINKMLTSTSLYNYPFNSFDADLRSKINDENSNAKTASMLIGYSHDMSQKLYNDAKNFIHSIFANYFTTKRSISDVRTYITNKLNKTFK